MRRSATVVITWGPPSQRWTRPGSFPELTIRKVERDGKSRWVLDIPYKTVGSKRERYRRDTQVQTKCGAEAEHRRLLVELAQTGTLTKESASEYARAGHGPVGGSPFPGTASAWSKASALDASPRPVCFRTPSHTTTLPFFQRVR